MVKNISYVTIYNPNDIHKWSGSSYFIAKSLKEQGNNLDFIGDLETKASLFLKIRKNINKLQGRNFFLNREPLVVEHFTKQIIKRINPHSEVIFSPGSVPISLLETNKPKVFYTDATFAGMVDFYDSYSNLSPATIRHGHYLEKKAIDSAALAIYTSEWAASSAINYYKADPAKVRVVPFGANLIHDKTFSDLQSIIDSKDDKELNLLFIGVEWKRKGADIAIGIAKKLNEMGVKTKLHMVGLKQIPVSLPDFVINHGFISKSSVEGSDKLTDLYNKAHFLLVPSRAEAFGIVFAEANSFGIPSISTNVGGIASVIREDINGKMFLLNDGPDKYADYIYSVFHDKKRYKELCLSSFNEFNQRLNWRVVGKALSNLIQNM